MRLRKAVSDLTLDAMVLKETIEGQSSASRMTLAVTLCAARKDVLTTGQLTLKSGGRQILVPADEVAHARLPMPARLETISN